MNYSMWMAHGKKTSLDSCWVQIFSSENPLDSAENQNHFREKQNEVCESVIFSAQINTIHGVERFVVLPLRKLKGQEPQRCMCAVICTVTNCSHYFHNEMYYFNRETLLRVPFQCFQAGSAFAFMLWPWPRSSDRLFIYSARMHKFVLPLLHCKLHKVKDHIKFEHHCTLHILQKVQKKLAWAHIF